MNNISITDPSANDIRPPVIETNTDTLPSAVTFFMTQNQRRSLLRILRSIDTNRSNAMLIAMNIDQQPIT